MSACVVLSGLLLVVAAAAAVLSFAALRDLALLCGFAPTLAWLLPVVVDAGAAAGSLVWLGGWADEPARRFARALALALLGSSVAANALGHGLAAFALAPAWWVVVIVSAVAPAVLGAVVHLAVVVGRTEPTTTAADADPTDDADVVEPVRAEPVREAYEDGLLTEHGLSRRWDGAPCSTAPRAVGLSTDGGARVDGDVRVAELVELLTGGGGGDRGPRGGVVRLLGPDRATVAHPRPDHRHPERHPGPGRGAGGSGVAAMRSLPDPAAPRRGRWRRTRTALFTAGAAALAAQLVPWVHVMLAVLVAASWTVIGLLVARALAHRYGLQLPAWMSVSIATRAVIRLMGRRRAPRPPTPVLPPLAPEQDWYELVGGPVMSSAGER